MARALLILACLLLAVPGLFIAAKGAWTLRTRRARVQGREVTGGGAVLAGLALLGWAVGMLGFAALVLARQLGR